MLINSKQIQFRQQLTNSDKQSVRNIALSSGFFRDDEVDVAVELVEEVIQKGEASGYHFIFAELNGITAGFACFGPIPCTIGSFDLYWIAVDEKYRAQGLGKLLLRQVELSVEAMGGRQIFIETSSTLKYEPTRNFYITSGYLQVARLPDFYLIEDDKLIFSRKIKS